MATADVAPPLSTDSGDTREPRHVALLLPMRTVLLVAATLAVLGAFGAIGETFLLVFVGIFLALVFEFPVRLVMRKTGLSRGLAATVTVLGTALAVLVLALLFLVPIVGGVRDFLQELPTIVEQLRESDELSWLGDSGAAENVQSGAESVSVVGAGRDLRRPRHGRQLLLRSSSPASPSCSSASSSSATSESEARAGERVDARRGRALAECVGEGDGVDLALGDRRRRDLG